MTEEKKAKIRKGILAAEILLAAVLLGYIVFGLVTKNPNQKVFNILAVILVVGFVVLNDFLEPYLTKAFEEMDSYRMEAYKKYLLWDIAAMAGLLIFVFNISNTDDSTLFIVGIALYFIGTKQKRTYQSVYLGEVTKDDVEAAKAAGVDAESVKIDNTEEVQETSEAVEE